MGVMVGGLQVQDSRTKRPFFTLDLVDLDEAAAPRRVPMTFLSHGFTTDPTPGRNHIAAVFEKRGPGGALVDLVAGTVLSDIAPSAGCAFYGHGAFASDGASLFCVETELASKRGRLTVRDARDFRVLDEIPTFGESPHDCILLDPRTLIVTNGGGPRSGERGSVAVVDVASGSLIERIEIEDDSINAGHLAAASAETFAVSSAPRDGLPEKESPGGISFRRGGGSLRRSHEPTASTARMLGESLSVAIHPRSHLAVVTNPWGNLLTIWDSRDGSLLEARAMEFPRGVALTLDQRYFVITHGRGARVSLFDTEKVAPIRDVAEGAITGSHVFAWDPQRDVRR